MGGVAVGGPLHGGAGIAGGSGVAGTTVGVNGTPDVLGAAVATC